MAGVASAAPLLVKHLRVRLAAREKDDPMPNITTYLWFDTQGEEAATFYCGIFPNSGIRSKAYNPEGGPGPAGTVLTVGFDLDGKSFVALNGGPVFHFTEAISLSVECRDQAEIDYYWSRLQAGGGREVECGWLRDQYGLSWQIVPASLEGMITDPDRAKAARVLKAVWSMKKLDLAAIEAAYRGDS